jgi:hypothetical protein
MPNYSWFDSFLLSSSSARPFSREGTITAFGKLYLLVLMKNTMQFRLHSIIPNPINFDVRQSLLLLRRSQFRCVSASLQVKTVTMEVSGCGEYWAGDF